VRSPSDGLVDQRFIEPGEPVAIGTPLISLQVVHTMRVHTWVSEADVFFLRAGNAASVTLSGLPLRDFDAVVEWVGVNADDATGNFPVKLLLRDESDRIRPGMTATTRIEGLGLDDMLVLPESALVDRDRRRIVFIATQEDGRSVARLREPQLAAGFANRLVVLAGLDAGDRVIVSNQTQLVDGREIELTP
jgi:membrane fusion protein (multidrug efflux system)